jgi:ribosomal protein S18 acetylase RimI-like enzyme
MAMPRLASGYVSNVVYTLEREPIQAGIGWKLQERKLDRPFRKVYDQGDPNDWLASYADAGSASDFEFLLAETSGSAMGLLTWKPVGWNGTAWLLDIRVRENARRQGVAGILVENLKRDVRARRLRGINLETQTTNYGAVRFYQKHGFGLAGFHDHLYSNKDTASGEIAIFLFWEAR